MLSSSTPHPRILTVLCALSSLCLPMAAPGQARGKPAVSLALEDLGYTPPQATSLVQGGIPYAVHFVDDAHLLLTFNSRGLLPRLTDTEPEDNDTNVTALLIELPSGKVAAKTVFRERDRLQYLWPLGHGRFLLRVRSHLTVIAPVANLASGEAFHQDPFADFDRRIGFVTTSPGGDLLLIETLPPLKAASVADVATPGDADAASQIVVAAPKPQVELRFFRITAEGKAESRAEDKADAKAERKADAAEPKLIEPRATETRRLAFTPAGALAAQSMIHVAVNSDGFVATTQDAQGYLFDFQLHGGKRMELAGFETNCAPYPYMISRTEFIAFGCHGSTDKQQLGYFNFRGENPWVGTLSGKHILPVLGFAPAAGRFVLSRLLTTQSFTSVENLNKDDIASQEVTVRQNYDGRVLLKLAVDPVERTEQNFDLSPDGLALAVVQTGALNVYRLPELTSKDRGEVKLAEHDQPAHSEVRIALKSTGANPPASEPVANRAVTASSAPVTGAPGAVIAAEPVVALQAPAAPTPGNTVGDVPQDQEHRKPPTLYSPEYPK